MRSESDRQSAASPVLPAQFVCLKRSAVRSVTCGISCSCLLNRIGTACFALGAELRTQGKPILLPGPVSGLYRWSRFGVRGMAAYNR